MTAPNQYQVDLLLAYDIEVYPNYFLVGIMDATDRVWQFTEVQDFKNFQNYMRQYGYILVGFNSHGYDDLITTEWMNCLENAPGAREKHAHKESGKLINGERKPWKFDNHVNSIDIMPLLPGRMSLKQIGVRLGHDRLQELPIDPMQELTEEQKPVIKDYNINDLQITWKLIHELRGELELRSNMSNTYNIDLRSKGDAQIAEAVIANEIADSSDLDIKGMKDKAKNNKAGDEVRVQYPSWWDDFCRIVEHYQETHLFRILDSQYKRFDTPIPLDANGRLLAGALSSTVYLDDAYYQTGVGGLHSVDGAGSYTADDDHFLMDIDVTSYYPYICLTQEAFPRHIHKYFAEVYEKIVNQRIAAKKAGDMITANSLKITINASFGKSSDPYSALYDPLVTATITITGQVALLILIAMLADEGINTVSANTDGLTAYGKESHRAVMHRVVEQWENLTGFNMEYTEYKSTYALDVNNYCAIKTDGKIKAKGRFVTPSPGKHDLRHSLNFNVCADAVKAALSGQGSAAEIEKAIKSCTDINQFLLTHAATGEYKCYCGDEHLGKLIRFYKSTERGLPQITKHRPGQEPAQVPNSENCKPLMDLPATLPPDIDYEWYEDKANEWFAEVTTPKAAGNNRLAHKMAEMGYSPTLVPVDPAKRSAAFLGEGSMDFNAIPQGMRMGISTGNKAGVVAAIDTVTGHPLLVYRTKHPFPPSTRKKIEKDSNIRIVYGANVWLPEEMVTPILDISNLMRKGLYKEFYTPAELKKVGVILDGK